MDISAAKKTLKTEGIEVSSPTPTAAPEQKPSSEPVKMDGHYYKPAESSPTPEHSAAISQETQNTQQARAAAHQQEVQEQAEIKRAAELAEADAQEITTRTAQGDISGAKDVGASQQNSKNHSIFHQSEKSSQYAEVLTNKDKTIYEKTSDILDDYMKSHPEEYPGYSKMNAEQKRVLRDRVMGEIYTKLTGKAKEKRTKEEHKTATRDFAILLATLEAQGKTLSSVKNNPSELKSIIGTGQKALYGYMLDCIDPSNPDKALNDLAELYLTFTDKKYLQLEGKDKAAYLKSKQNDVIKMLAISPEMLRGNDKATQQAKSNAASLLVGLLSGLADKGMDIGDFAKLSAKQQTEILFKSVENYLTAHPEFENNVTPASKKAWAMLQERQALIHETRKENPTERDIYNILLKKEKDGSISENGRAMLDSYRFLDVAGKKNGKYYLDDKATIIPSNTLQEMVTGMSSEAQCTKLLAGVKDKNPKQAALALEKYFRGMLKDSNTGIQYAAAIKVLQEQGYNIKDIIDNLPSELREKMAAYVLADSDAQSAAAGVDALAVSYDTPELKSSVDDLVKTRTSTAPVPYVQQLLAQTTTTIFDESAASGVNSRNISEANSIFKYCATNATTDAKKSSIVKYSLLTTDDPNRVSVYTNTYKEIKNAAVTEGMAAAANQSTNSEIKNIISTGVDYAIQNNGYSQEEINNINTARETGTTSYDRSSASESSSSSSSQSSSSNSTSQSASASQSSSSASNTKVSVSQENQQAVQQMRDTLAQLQVEASQAKKEKAMAELERIIDKIQTDQQVRAKKQAELSSKEAKSEAEIKAAMQEEKAKSAQQQKESRVKVAQAVVSEIVSQNTSQYSQIPSETLSKIHSAAKNGQLDVIYNELGKISASAQQHFIQSLAKKDLATIIGFIRSKGADKSLIKSLCSLNPNLIKSLPHSLLLTCGIEKTEIIKYSDSHQLAKLLVELQQGGNRDRVTLNQFYEVLGSDADRYMVSSSTTPANKPVPGTAEWESQMRFNMRRASASSMSTVVSSSRFPDGQTRQKIRPQDIDYREYLA